MDELDDAIEHLDDLLEPLKCKDCAVSKIKEPDYDRCEECIVVRNIVCNFEPIGE